MRSRLPAQLLEQRAHCVEFGAETGPVPRLQPIDRLIIVGERLAGPLIFWARGRRPGERRQGGEAARIP